MAAILSGRRTALSVGGAFQAAALFLVAAGCDLMPPKPVHESRAAKQSVRLDEVVRPADLFVDGKILLGSPSLTAGIPGSGPLTLADVEVWLADSKNHEPLEFVLPLGLRSLAGEVKIPVDNPLTRAKIELGRQLFVDPRLSGPGRNHACFHCHMPGKSYTGVDLAGDPAAGVPLRIPPSILNRIFTEAQFWDGRRATLEAQVTDPIFSPYEMNSTPEALTAFLEQTPAYRRQFEVIFGEVSVDNAARALAAFVRNLVGGESPYDFWAEVQAWKDRDPASLSEAERNFAEKVRAFAALNPLSPTAQKGRDLFFGKAGCHACHSGPNFSDEKYHNVGAGWSEPLADAGRERVTGRLEDRGAFKTPTLRNLRNSRRYMHDDHMETLEEVVAWLSQGGTPNPHLDPLVKPLNLSPAEQKQLLAFLEALNGRVPNLALGRLPEAAP